MLDGLAGKFAGFVNLEQFDASDRVPYRLVIGAACALRDGRLCGVAHADTERLDARRHDPDVMPAQRGVWHGIAVGTGPERGHLVIGQTFSPGRPPSG
jgi:hypothetical protein